MGMWRKTGKGKGAQVAQVGDAGGQATPAKASRLSYRNWRIAAKIAAGFVLVLAVYGAVSGIVTWNVLRVREDAAGAAQDTEKLLLIEQLSRVTLAKFSDIQDVVIEGDVAKAEEFERNSRQFADLLARLEAMNLDQTEKETLGYIRQFDAGLSGTFRERLLPAIQKKDDWAAKVIYRGEISGVQYQVVNLSETLRQRLEKRQQEAVASINRHMAAVVRTMYVGLALAILAGILIIWFTTRQITRPLGQLQRYALQVAQGDLTLAAAAAGTDEIGRLTGAFGQMVANLRQLIGQVSDAAQRMGLATEQVAASANEVGEAGRQVAATVQEMAKGMEEQNQQVNDTAQAISRVTAEIGEVNNLVQTMAQRSAAVLDAVSRGREAAAQAVGQMEAITERMRALTRVVGELGQRSQEIGRIVEVITAIAGQTNLLALNAAIEAARAGDQGRGFAVVAEEVRKLAEQAAEAAEQITELARGIQADAGRAVAAIEEGNQEMGRGMAVIKQSDESFDHIQKVTEAFVGEIREVAGAADRVTGAVREADQAVQSIAGITEEVAAGTEEVSAQAQQQSAGVEEIVRSLQDLERLAKELEEAVQRFKL